MPLVAISYNGSRLTPNAVHGLAQLMCELVANNLTVPEVKDAQIRSADVEVDVKKHDTLGIAVSDYRIIVQANDYPERRPLLPIATKSIAVGVQKYLKQKKYDVKGSVWVQLVTAEFMEIPIT